MVAWIGPKRTPPIRKNVFGKVTSHALGLPGLRGSQGTTQSEMHNVHCIRT